MTAPMERRYVSPEGWELRGLQFWSDRTIPGRWVGATEEWADAVFANMRAEKASLPIVAEELAHALRESVKLQSHYAALLNDYDGGTRRVFADAEAWIARLRELGDAAGP